MPRFRSQNYALFLDYGNSVQRTRVTTVAYPDFRTTRAPPVPHPLTDV